MRDVWRLDDLGWDGMLISGPYEAEEASRRWPNSMLVRFLQKAPEPFYGYQDEPESGPAAEPVHEVGELLPYRAGEERDDGEGEPRDREAREPEEGEGADREAGDLAEAEEGGVR